MPSPRRDRTAVRVAVHHAAPLPFLGAAYALTERAYVQLSRKGRSWAAVLTPKSGFPALGLADSFAREYANQRLRWNLARAGLPARAAALALAGQAPRDDGAAGTPTLDPADRERLECLLAEGPVEDALAIRTPWDQLRGSKS